jgi:hypothetical protein
MYKLISKRGLIKEKTSLNDSYNNLKLKDFYFDCLFQHNCKDLEINNEILLVGYFANDDWGEKIFYVIAYYNISKNKISETKKKYLFIFIGLILITFSMLFYWKNIIVLIIFCFLWFFSFHIIYTLIAYIVLEEKIRNLGQNK